MLSMRERVSLAFAQVSVASRVSLSSMVARDEVI
jgi:hypothetical protein